MMPVAEITRAETEQRARLLRVRSYDVALDLTRGAEIFGSVSVIRFDAAEPGAASHADLVADAVHEITLNGVRLDPAAVYADGRITLPALAAHNELRVVGRLRLHRIRAPACTGRPTPRAAESRSTGSSRRRTPVPRTRASTSRT